MDGFPRTRNQAEALLTFADVQLALNLSLREEVWLLHPVLCLIGLLEVVLHELVCCMCSSRSMSLLLVSKDAQLEKSKGCQAELQ